MSLEPINNLILKPIKKGNYGSIIWLSLLLAVFGTLILVKWPGNFIGIFLFLVIWILFLAEICGFRHKLKYCRWTITPDSIEYDYSGLFKKKSHMKISDIKHIQFDIVTKLSPNRFRFERGIRIISVNNAKIFIPQNTDRYDEAKKILKGFRVSK